MTTLLRAILAMAALTAAASAQVDADAPLARIQSPGSLKAFEESSATQSVTLPNEPTVAAGEDFRVPIHTGEADLGQPYGIWGVGGSYKVSFHDGATFIPYLGSAAPRNLPVRWTTQRVTAGGSVLMEVGDTPHEVYEDYRYEYRFNAVTEAYDVLVEGLEQTFVIANRPATAGDLVVEGRIETPMKAENFTAAHRSIDFMGNDGVVYTRYSEAFVFDARGSKESVLTSYHDGVVRLTIDAQFIADAQFPITLDPLQTRRHITGGTLRTSPDVARDDQANRVAVVFSLVASREDRDAFCRLLGDCFTKGGALGQIVWSDANAWDTPHIRIATLGNPQKYLIAFERRFSNPQLSRRVRYRVQDAGSFNHTTQYNSIRVPQVTHSWRPDCGGTTWSVHGNEGIIVFQGENTNGSPVHARSTIFGVTVDATAGIGSSATHSAAFDISARPDFDHERVAVTRQADARSNAPTSWVVAWQQWNGRVIDGWDAFARQVNNAGALSSEYWSTSRSRNPLHNNTQKGVTIDGKNGRYLVAYSEKLGLESNGTHHLTALGTAVYAERFDWPDGGAITKFDQVPLWSSFDRRWRVGDCAYDFDSDSFWVVPVISDAVTGSGTGNIYLHRIGYTGAQTDQVTLHRAGGLPNNQAGNGASAYYDDDADLFQVAYTANVDPSGSNWSRNAVYGNCYLYDSFTPWSTSGFGCSPARISWSARGGSNTHDQQIGNEFGSVSVRGAAATSFQFVLVGLRTMDLPLVAMGNVPGCRLLVPRFYEAGHLMRLPEQMGANASFEFPLPPNLPQATLYFQGIHTNAAGDRYLSTSRLEVPVVR